MVKKKDAQGALIPVECIERRIYSFRGRRVILDADIADLYGVTTKALNQAVSRNRDRFPEDFMFRLDRDELALLRSQTVTSSSWGGRRYPPYAFTEHGVAMLATVLRGRCAVEVSVAIIRAFVRLRELLSSHADLARKLEEMERRYDKKFAIVFDAIRELMAPPPAPQDPGPDPVPLGFRIKKRR